MQTTPSLPEISPHELKQKLDANESVFLLDVREPSEYDSLSAPKRISRGKKSLRWYRPVGSGN